MVDSVDVDDRGRRLGDRDRRRLGEAQDLDAEVDPEGQDDDGQQRDHDQARREGQALARRRDRLGHDDRRRLLLAVAALTTPLDQDLVRVEPEVERVVAQEALGVDRARQLLVVAALEGAQVARPDLGVALGPVEVDALALACGVQPFRQARRRLGGDAPAGVRPVDPHRSLELLPCRHPSSPSRPSSGVPAELDVSSRRSTCRAFDPSNAPI